MLKFMVSTVSDDGLTALAYYSDVTWRLKSPATQLFVQYIVHFTTKETLQVCIADPL